eukprot:TRINITY_DN2941_c0_g1_i1.p1 TRINITY_DN2941_c0_g1~~TRINITY_DN2941_c0_g1_i1.p1  ORF type:complete len:481 (-),score=176.59 TRINITY_DN2941_c0_g1_i1:8-1450(-)
MIVFFFKQKTAYEIAQRLVGSEMCIRDRLDKVNKEIEELEAKIEAERKKQLDQRTGWADDKSSVISNTVATRPENRKSDDIKRKIKSQEYKLDKLKQRYNQTIAQNKQLKDQIDALRRERVIFDKIYKNLESELKQKKKIMSEKIEKAEESYLERHFGNLHLMEAKEKAKNERKEFEEEWKKIEAKIEESKKVYDYPKHNEENKIAEMKKADQNAFKDLRAEEEKQRKALDQTMKELTEIEKNIDKLKKETNIGSIEEIVKAFKEYEDTNASLSKHVSDLNSDLSKIEKQIADTKREIDQYKGAGLMGEDPGKEQVDAELASKIEDTSKKIDFYQKKYDDTMKTISALKVGIKNIYDNIKCKEDDPEEKEDKAVLEITESNMLFFLGAIEERTNEILQMYDLCKSKGTAKIAGEANEQLVSANVDLKEVQEKTEKLKPGLEAIEFTDNIPDQKELMQKIEQHFKEKGIINQHRLNEHFTI